MTRADGSDRHRWGRVAWLAAWLAVACVGVLGFLLTFTQLSHIDEYQHVDYLDRTLQLEHVRGGDQVEELAMREQACRGMDLEGFVLPPCSSPDLQPEQFPGSGYNHTYVDPPTYYVVTGPLAKVVQAVTGLDSLVTAARGIGVLWLGSGLIVTFVLARRLGADTWSAGGATLLLAGAPMVLQASATVTTDAPQLVAGGVLTLVAVGVVERKISPWWLAVAGAAAMSVKATSLLVVGMVALFLVVQAVRDRSGRKRAAWPVALLAVGSALPTLAWAAYTRATELPAAEEIPAFQGYKAGSIGFHEVSRSVDDLVSPVGNSIGPLFTQSPAIALFSVVVNLLLIVGVAGLAWFGRRADLSTTLARSLLAVMVLGGPALVVLFFVGEQLSVTIPGRYGLCLLPAAAACLAVAASRRRYGGPALLVLGVLGLGAFVAACL